MRLLGWLKRSSDSAASIMVILALVFFVTFGSTFLVIQVSKLSSACLKTKTCNFTIKYYSCNWCKSQLGSRMTSSYLSSEVLLSRLWSLRVVLYQQEIQAFLTNKVFALNNSLHYQKIYSNSTAKFIWYSFRQGIRLKNFFSANYFFHVSKTFSH